MKYFSLIFWRRSASEYVFGTKHRFVARDCIHALLEYVMLSFEIA